MSNARLLLCQIATNQRLIVKFVTYFEIEE